MAIRSELPLNGKLGAAALAAAADDTAACMAAHPHTKAANALALAAGSFKGPSGHGSAGVVCAQWPSTLPKPSPRLCGLLMPSLAIWT